jgi:hypothetical protein
MVHLFGFKERISSAMIIFVLSYFPKAAFGQSESVNREFSCCGALNRCREPGESFGDEVVLRKWHRFFGFESRQ